MDRPQTVWPDTNTRLTYALRFPQFHYEGSHRNSASNILAAPDSSDLQIIARQHRGNVSVTDDESLFNFEHFFKIYIHTNSCRKCGTKQKLITESYLMLAFQIFHTIPIALLVLRSNIYSELLITRNRIITHSPTAKTRLRMSHDLCREMCLR